MNLDLTPAVGILPNDWPTAGPIDLRVHDLPHTSATSISIAAATRPTRCSIPSRPRSPRAATIRTRFGLASSPLFDPDVHLSRIGLANQTTMLMSESLEIQERLREAMRDRHGSDALAGRFRAFDTICSATQDRQDAVRAMLEEGGLDLMIVIGGYNSSNTQALAGMCAPRLPTYHIEGAQGLGGDVIRHRPVGRAIEASTAGWLPRAPLAIGLTAGASTPDSVVGAVVERLLALRGCTAGDLMAAGAPAAIPGCV